MVSRLIEELGVEASQAAEIHTIHVATVDAIAADRERLQMLRDELRNQQDDFDPGEAQKLADEIGEIAGRLAYEMSAMRAAVRGVLTDAQREQLDALREEHEGGRQGKGRWRDPRQR
jgi:Spy/CpxP family protein refolding chaperone